MTEIRVLIVEDHPMFVSGLRALLATDERLTLVGEARTAAAGIRLAREQQPDVILMDLRLPDSDGAQATRTILAEQPEAAILVLSMLDDERSVGAAIRAGARGYLLKDSDDTEILEAIHTVRGGSAIFDPAVAPQLTRLVGPTAHAARPRRPFPQLTERECQILDLVACGLSNAEISAQLVLSPKTVRNYVSTILTKIDATSRPHAIVLARQAGLG